MEIAHVLELWQLEEPVPAERDRVFNMSMDFQFPFVERDFGADAEVEDGEIMHLMLARRKPVLGTDGWLFLAGHFAGPPFLRSDVRFLHWEKLTDFASIYTPFTQLFRASDIIKGGHRQVEQFDVKIRLRCVATTNNMQAKTVLVIEDDSAIRQGIIDALQFAGYSTLHSGDGAQGLAQALKANFDLLMLDLILPGASGFDILKQVRENRPTLPIIILTARGEEADRVNGLRLGADDYVVKPFSVREVLARVEAVLRRSPERPESVGNIKVPCGTIDLARREIRYSGGDRCELSEREVELLRYLASHPGRALSRDEILVRVWRLDPKGITTRTIDMHVANLREKLRDDPEKPEVLLTVRGRGYMFGPGTK
jgi:DNA-binding response OmpR family regulator